ncbi:MAG: hypothetical protein GX640_01305 [Fibrobacter sp.]|nr:hypothetical protein [Fibrobacter sp.]
MEMSNYDDYKIAEKLLREIQLLEDEVEVQAYINGLWVRHYHTLKKAIESEVPGSVISDAVQSGVKESPSWEDVSDWLHEAKKAESEFFERIEPDILDSSDVQRLKSEINFLKGVIRALLSTREMKLETILSGYKEWNTEVNREISELLELNNLASDG